MANTAAVDEKDGQNDGAQLSTGAVAAQQQFDQEEGSPLIKKSTGDNPNDQQQRLRTTQDPRGECRYLNASTFACVLLFLLVTGALTYEYARLSKHFLEIANRGYVMAARGAEKQQIVYDYTPNGATLFTEMEKLNSSYSVQINGYAFSGSGAAQGMLSCMSHKICAYSNLVNDTSEDFVMVGGDLAEPWSCLVDVDTNPGKGKIRHAFPSNRSNTFNISMLHREKVRFNDLKCDGGLLAIGGNFKKEFPKVHLDRKYIQQRTGLSCNGQRKWLIPLLNDCIEMQWNSFQEYQTNSTKLGNWTDDVQRKINYTECIPGFFLDEPDADLEDFPPMRVLLTLRNPVDTILSLPRLDLRFNLKWYMLQQTAMMIYRYVTYRKMEEKFKNRFQMIVSSYEDSAKHPNNHWAKTFKKLMMHEKDHHISDSAMHKAATSCSRYVKDYDAFVQGLANRYEQPGEREDLYKLVWKLLPADEGMRKELIGLWKKWLVLYGSEKEVASLPSEDAGLTMAEWDKMMK